MYTYDHEFMESDLVIKRHDSYSLSYKVRKDALHPPEPLRCFAPSKTTPKRNLAMAKIYVGHSIKEFKFGLRNNSFGSV
jgi:hypothetical protein